ncbi:unnamed protein product, partial [Laminaria digitata]
MQVSAPPPLPRPVLPVLTKRDGGRKASVRLRQDIHPVIRSIKPIIDHECNQSPINRLTNHRFTENQPINDQFTDQPINVPIIDQSINHPTNHFVSSTSEPCYQN